MLSQVEISKVLKGFSTAESRWARFGPYYAMFPLDFAFDVIRRYSKPGDYILDPFAGRCSSIYAGGVLGRNSLGIEINPVGWLYGQTKLNPGSESEVIDRLLEVYGKRNYYSRSLDRMPPFYRMCFCDEVLKFLLCLRSNLDWENNDIDATLISIVLVYLHGNVGESLSNQMQMTMSMGMGYSMRWWTSNGFHIPPQLDPCEFLIKKIKWRYAKGIPQTNESQVVFGDSAVVLPRIVKRAERNDIKFSLLFTSPPYCSVTDYHKDQWLRLWLLGGSENPQTNSDKHRGRFVNKTDYYQLLDNIFMLSARVMHERSTIYIRTDKRDFTYTSTKEILSKHFPNHSMRTSNKPIASGVRTQTEIYGRTSNKPGEVDIILRAR